MLREDHPSYGCDQAWFLFSMSSSKTITRLLLVEAKNEYSVATIERIVAMGRINSSCELLTVHRQCDSIGIRSEMVTSVDYIDFMLDVVDPSRIISDPLTAQSFRNSMSQEDRVKAMSKMDATQDEEPDGCDLEDVKLADVIPIRRFNSSNSQNYQDVLAALMDLGYKKLQARKSVDSLGSTVDELELGDAVKAALQNCSGV